MVCGMRIGFVLCLFWGRRDAFLQVRFHNTIGVRGWEGGLLRRVFHSVYAGAFELMVDVVGADFRMSCIDPFSADCSILF